MNVETKREEDVRRGGLRRDGVFPESFAALDPKAAQAGGLEDPELMATERLWVARAGRDVADGEAQTGCVGSPATKAQTRGTEGRAEKRSAEPERGDARGYEEHRGLVLEARVQAHVQL